MKKIEPGDIIAYLNAFYHLGVYIRANTNIEGRPVQWWCRFAGEKSDSCTRRKEFLKLILKTKDFDNRKKVIPLLFKYPVIDDLIKYSKKLRSEGYV